MKIGRIETFILGTGSRYGDAAKLESAKRAEELATDGDLAGVAVWLRIIDATGQLAIKTPFGACALGAAARRIRCARLSQYQSAACCSVLVDCMA
jgi:hypothetical protein